MRILDCEQGSPEWLQARAGLVTCSELQCLLVNGKSDSGLGAEAISYMYRIIGERMTGQPTESFSNVYTERGHALEPYARELYMLQTDEVATTCGFIINHGIGFSPDSLVGDVGLNEIKTKSPHLQAKVLYENVTPAEHMAQMQGGLWVSEREWCDFVSYCSGMPLFVNRVYRDEVMIKKISERVDAFYTELERRLDVIVSNAA